MRLLGLGVAAAAAVLLLAGPSGATFPATQQRLVILTEASGFAGLELLGPGSQEADFTVPLGVGGSAAVSADGTHIALNFSVPFDPSDPTSEQAFTTDFLGTEGGLIASNAAGGGRPSWSPDGSRVVYAARDSGGRWDVYVTASDGSGAPADLTNTPAANDRNPRWSPDGKTIAFESDRTGNWDVFSMQSDGSSQTNLTSNPAEERLGDWSPDSSRLVFSSTRSGGGDLYVMPAAGGAATQITSGPGADTHAAWSPDGTTIAYSNDAGVSTDVYEVAPDGSNVRRLTNNDYVDLVQDWQPLIDTQVPVVHAVASTGLRHHSVVLKFRVADNAAHVAVVVDLRFGNSEFNGAELVSVKPGRTSTFKFPYSFLRKPPASFRFCVQAGDPSLNESKTSCARFHFVKPKKKKRG
jgi:dipeptidyl aminopeptidase/acylaminoacyl peptidase